MSKFYVGVDIALRKSGIVVLDENKNIVLHEVYTVSDKLSQWEAVHLIFIKLSSLVEKYPDAIWIIEDVLAVVHIKAALAIHAARTAVTLALLNSHVSHENIVYYTPNSVKYWLTRKRGAKKDEVKSLFEDKYPQYIDYNLSEDEIDAILLILRHLEGGEEIVKSRKKPVRGLKRKKSP